MTVARKECCRVAVDRSSARNVRNQAVCRFVPDRVIDFERYELNVWVGVSLPHPTVRFSRRVMVQWVVG